MTMYWLDLTFSTPHENLACDEVLLEMMEKGEGEEVLRFWEAPAPFVVLGSSNSVVDEVHLEACRADGIPILRRHSGGGTVLQEPGCLSYALTLRIEPSRFTRTITETTYFVMQRHADALSALLGTKVSIEGSSDLTIDGKKFSGNAQRRKLRALLFHGTFLLNADLSSIERYLHMPARQPEYRQRRSHTEFLCNIACSADAIKHALREAWNAAAELSPPLSTHRVHALAQTKYASDEWIWRR
ncbi:MAG: lipoate--protein ligase family protein [Ignavibacteria bacterium]